MQKHKSSRLSRFASCNAILTYSHEEIMILDVTSYGTRSHPRSRRTRATAKFNRIELAGPTRARATHAATRQLRHWLTEICAYVVVVVAVVVVVVDDDHQRVSTRSPRRSAPVNPIRDARATSHRNTTLQLSISACRFSNLYKIYWFFWKILCQLFFYKLIFIIYNIFA